MLQCRFFVSETDLIAFVNASGVRIVHMEYPTVNNKRWILYFEGPLAAVGMVAVPGPYGPLVLSENNRSWWTKGPLEAALPAPPANPGTIDTAHAGDDRTYNVYGGTGTPNQFALCDVTIIGTTWVGAETISVYAVQYDDTEILLLAAAAADAAVGGVAARLTKRFRIETAGIAAATDVEVNIALY